MTYKSIRRMVAMSRSARRPDQVARYFYEERIAHPSVIKTGITLGEANKCNQHEMFAVMTADIVRMIDDIYTLDRQVRVRWKRLPDFAQDIYVKSLIAREIESTNKVESIDSSWEEVWSAVSVSSAQKGAKRDIQTRSVSGSQKHTKKHIRFESLAHLYFTVRGSSETDECAAGTGHDALPHSLQEIRDIYDLVMQGEIEKGNEVDGQIFRKNSVAIYDPGRLEPTHQGVRNEADITQYMRLWLRLQCDERIPALLRAIMCHFLFEYVHPFYDGNGRTGRYLLTQHLSTIVCFPVAASLSRVIHGHKAQYYKAFEEAEDSMNCAELTMFCERMLKFVLETESDVNDALETRSFEGEMLGVLPVDIITQLLFAQDLYGYKRDIGLTIQDIATYSGMGRNRVAQILKEMVVQGTVIEIPGAGRRAGMYVLGKKAR
ncbi:Fic family protein [Alloscardovia venturai]|uniref:Fic family protein n=1 Tax=Alloscardovia venturai TaxID=1769421 RepID=A0ABW2Y1W0_9BIFI